MMPLVTCEVCKYSLDCHLDSAGVGGLQSVSFRGIVTMQEHGFALSLHMQLEPSLDAEINSMYSSDALRIDSSVCDGIQSSCRSMIRRRD